MRKFILFGLLIIIFSATSLLAQIKFGFYVGIATPNERINDVYNSDNLNWNQGLSQYIREGTKIGYDLGMRLRLTMIPDLYFCGGIGWNRFPETEIKVRNPKNQDSIIAVLTTTQNIIPISAGIQYYLFKSSFGIYGTVDLAYNYISNSVNIVRSNVEIPISSSPTDSRVGFGIGVGMDFDIKLLTINLEGKYNVANLIGKTSDEKPKEYFNVNLGVFF